MEYYMGTIFAFGFNYPPEYFAFCNGQTVAFSQYQALFSLIGTYYGGDGRTTIGLPNLQSRVPVGFSDASSLPGGLTPHKLGLTGGSENSVPKGTGLGAFTLTSAQVPLAAHTHPATFTPTTTGSQTVKIPATTGNLAVKVEVDANSNGTTATPSSTNNQLGGAKIYAPSGGTQTALAGVSTTISGTASTAETSVTINNLMNGGSVAVQNNATTTAAAVSVPVSLTGVTVPTVMPFLALNFCIALNGIYPIRPQ